MGRIYEVNSMLLNVSHAEIVREYEQAKEKSQNQAKNIEEKPVRSRENQQEREATPFR